MYIGRHPVFVSHMKEIEQLDFFLANLQHRLIRRGQDSGKEYDCLLRVRSRCSELLLRMSGEDSEIMLMNDVDYWWVRKIIYFLHDVILKDRRKIC